MEGGQGGPEKGLGAGREVGGLGKMGACSLGRSWAPRSCAGDSRFLVAASVGDGWCWWLLLF